MVTPEEFAALFAVWLFELRGFPQASDPERIARIAPVPLPLIVALLHGTNIDAADTQGALDGLVTAGLLTRHEHAACLRYRLRLDDESELRASVELQERECQWMLTRKNGSRFYAEHALKPPQELSKDAEQPDFSLPFHAGTIALTLEMPDATLTIGPPNERVLEDQRDSAPLARICKVVERQTLDEREARKPPRRANFPWYQLSADGRDTLILRIGRDGQTPPVFGSGCDVRLLTDAAGSIADGNGNPRRDDPVPIPWLRRQVTREKVRGDSTKLRLWLERRRVPTYKIARKWHANRADLLPLFSGRVRDLIEQYGRS